MNSTATRRGPSVLFSLSLFRPSSRGRISHATHVCSADAYGELLAGYLEADDYSHVLAAKYMLAWPQALSIFIGFASDSFPIFGYRRKSYMVLGLVISVVAYIIVACIDTYNQSELDASSSAEASATATRYPVAYLLLSLAAAIGIQISWVSSLILGIEYAQRETLLHRGALIATMVSLFYFGGFVAYIVAAVMTSSGATGAVIDMSIGGAAGVLAVASSIAIPFVIWGLKEEPFEALLGFGTVKYLSVRQRVSHLWRFCHHTFVYRVLFFIRLHLFLASVYDQDVKEAVVYWSDMTASGVGIVKAARKLAF